MYLVIRENEERYLVDCQSCPVKLKKNCLDN